MELGRAPFPTPMMQSLLAHTSAAACIHPQPTLSLEHPLLRHKAVLAGGGCGRRKRPCPCLEDGCGLWMHPATEYTAGRGMRPHKVGQARSPAVDAVAVSFASSEFGLQTSHVLLLQVLFPTRTKFGKKLKISNNSHNCFTIYCCTQRSRTAVVLYCTLHSTHLTTDYTET